MTKKNLLTGYCLVLVTLSISACSPTVFVEPSDKYFKRHEGFENKAGTYSPYDGSDGDLYRAYAGNQVIFPTLTTVELRDMAMARAEAFAAERGKLVRVLGDQSHQGGNEGVNRGPSRVEITFALVDPVEILPSPRRIDDSPVLLDID